MTENEMTAAELREWAEARQVAERLATGELSVDLADAPVVPAPPPPAAGDEPMVVTTLRLPPEKYLQVKRAAEQRGLKTSAFLRELVEAALVDLDDREVTVNLADLHRYINRIAKPAA
jgi:predicted DNA-binding protein